MNAQRSKYFPVCLTLILVVAARAHCQETREIDLTILEDKVRGGMAGQMVGVSYGGPTEFRAKAEIYEAEIKWEPEMIGDALAQDDLYVEMTFTEVMDEHGLDAPIELYGEAFKDTQ